MIPPPLFGWEKNSEKVKLPYCSVFIFRIRNTKLQEQICVYGAPHTAEIKRERRTAKNTAIKTQDRVLYIYL